jgi:hypothetical protein
MSSCRYPARRVPLWVGQDQPRVVMPGLPARQGTRQAGFRVGKSGPPTGPVLTDGGDPLAKGAPVIPAVRAKGAAQIDAQHRMPTEVSDRLKQPFGI